MRGLKKKNDIVGFHFWKLVFVTHIHKYIVYDYTVPVCCSQHRGVSTHIAFIKRLKRSWWKQIVTDKGNRRKVKSQYYILTWRFAFESDSFIHLHFHFIYYIEIIC